MPGGDGRGPAGPGRGFGRGVGPGGRMGGPSNAGPYGFCVCPSCGERVRHERAVRCTAVKCPKCGTSMVRE